MRQKQLFFNARIELVYVNFDRLQFGSGRPTAIYPVRISAIDYVN